MIHTYIFFSFQIIPENSYKIGSSDYDGVFHCRFWRFGEWVDVYIDDYLPVIYTDKLWAAENRNPNVLWVALVEKAFAKWDILSVMFIGVLGIVGKPYKLYKI